MKYEKSIYALTSILIIVGAVMMLLNIRYGNAILILSLLVTSCYQWWHVTHLKKLVKELGGN